MNEDDFSMRTGGGVAIDRLRYENPSQEIRVIDDNIDVSHHSLEAAAHGHPTMSFFKKKDYIEMTAQKKDGNKLSQELTYQFSPRYKRKKDEILKPSPHQPPNVYSEGQLFEPIKFYKLVKQQKEK